MTKDIATCPYCNTELVEDFNFCVQCSQQVKCLSCGMYLLKDKTICLKCGTPTKAVNAGATNLNTYTFEENITETTSHKRVHLTATNEAVAAFLPRLPLGQESQSNVPSRATVVNSSPKALEELASPVDEEITQQHKIIETNTNETSIESLFVEDSEYEIIPGRRLRNYIQTLPSKAAKQKTFTICFVSAYNKTFSTDVGMEKLVRAVKNEGLHDSNYLRNLKGFAKDYFINKVDGYEIQPYDGEEFVQDSIRNIDNPGHSPRTEAKPVGKRSRAKRANRTNEVEEVQLWLDKSVEELRRFDSRVLKTPLEWGVFGLYVLTRHLKVAETVKPSSLYAYLAKQYPTMNHSRKNFLDAIKRAKSLGQNPEGDVFLDNQNEERITQMVQASMN